MDSKLIKDKGLCYVLKDMFANLNRCEIAFCSVISIFTCFIILLFSKNNFSSLLLDDILNIFPGLAGFSIACYTIIFTLGDKPIFKEFVKGKTVCSVLCSTFIFTILMQLLTIFIALIFKYIELCKILYSFILFVLTTISIFSIILEFNIVLHLFSIRTLNSKK